MYSKNSGRAPKGSVGIESFRGRLRIRLPRHLYDGKQKYLSTDLADTDINRRVVDAKAKLIESDIALERFDYILAKYSKPRKLPGHANPSLHHDLGLVLKHALVPDRT